MKKVINWYGIKRITSYIILLTVLVSLSACQGAVEINEMAIVNTMAVDTTDSGGIKLSVLAALPVNSNPGLNQPQGTKVWLGTAEGESILDAIHNLNSIATKKLVWYQVKFLIISKKTAQNGLEEINDFLIRDRNTRYSESVLVSEGDALDMIKIPANAESNLPQELDGIIKNASEWSEAYIPEMREFMSYQEEKNVDSILGRIRYETTSQDTTSVNREEVRKQYWLDRDFGLAVVEGCTIIKNHNFAGFLDRAETRGVLWITNRVKQGSVTLKSDEGVISLRIDSSDCDNTPEFKDNKVTIHINLDVNADLDETRANVELLKENDIEKLQKLCEGEIIAEMSQGINKAQKEYDADIFGFCELVKIKFPNEYKKMEDEWDKIYKDIDFTFDVNVILKRFGESY